MNVRLTKAQKQVLLSLREGTPLLEMAVPKKPFFRTLGKIIPCELVYRMNGKKLNYRTVRVLLKRNLIEPDYYDPRNGHQNFHLTVAGYRKMDRHFGH